ncbi:MAG: hypothetical protein A2017_17405 [Lentisphaerae bacterium GWF2_44_16]|nr:MAG: hypothetical protein A2017_17405 [Lentisphaerae bacterium GWF2_44_16]
MNSDDLKNFSMLGLFLIESETQAQSLSEGLIAVEKTPSAPELLESLMRAAHSLKGGAQIVQADMIVKFAHSMENYFSALMNGKAALNAYHIDRLLEGVDLVRKISETKEEDFNSFISSHTESFLKLASVYEDMKENRDIPAAENTETIKPSPPPPPPQPEKEEKKAVPVHEKDAHIPEEHQITQTFRKMDQHKDNFVKVTSAKMEKLLGLSGESFVAVKKMQTLENKRVGLKEKFMTISEIASKARDLLLEGKRNEEINELLSEMKDKSSEYYWAISDFANDFSVFSLSAESFSEDFYNELVSCKIIPFEDLSKVFPRTVRDVARKLGKHVEFQVSGEKTGVDRDILEKLEAPINHLLRNAIDHGLESPEARKAAGKNESGTIELSAFHWAGMLNITISDDGRGINLETVREKIIARGLATEDMVRKMPPHELLDFLFLPGFSTSSSVTEISGRGVGLDVVQNMVQDVKGLIKIETKLGKGTTFHMQLPITLSVISAMIVEIGEELYAFPSTKLDRLLIVPTEDLQTLENHQFINHENSNIGIVSGRELLSYPIKSIEDENIPLLIVSDRYNRYAVVVDRFLREEKIVVRPLDERLGKISCVSSASVLDDGSPVLVADVDDIVRSVDNLVKGNTLHKLSRSNETVIHQRRKKILVIDDSITVRELERHLLENKGYKVETAVDGIDGWNALRTDNYDIVITDIDMPRMNGFELVEKIKSHAKLRSIPVMIVSYKDREEDRVKGIDAGADYYLTKSSFHDNTLLEAVYNLIGDPA